MRLFRVFRDIIVRSEQAFREVGLPSLARLPRTRDTRALFRSPIARIAHAQWSVTDTAEERRMIAAASADVLAAKEISQDA